MNAVLSAVRDKINPPIAVVVLSVALVLVMIPVFRSGPDLDVSEDIERRLFVSVKWAISGQKLKLDNDKDEYLILAGIRVPAGDEPLSAEATGRANELVAQTDVRLRFDKERRDQEGRLMGYVFVDDLCVNEALVQEGLAYVRTTDGSNRFSERLLKAQAKARKARKGIWSQRRGRNGGACVADRKYGNFHRESCEDVAKTPRNRVEKFDSTQKALDKGFAPCSKCSP